MFYLHYEFSMFLGTLKHYNANKLRIAACLFIGWERRPIKCIAICIYLNNKMLSS